MPASVTPVESTTAMQPSGMSSIAARVEIGDAQDCGVAMSSRAGTKRTVKARPTRRGCPVRIGRAPRIQMLRNPFFKRTVVRVAVETAERASMAADDTVLADSLIRSAFKLVQMLGMKPPSTRMTEPVR